MVSLNGYQNCFSVQFWEKVLKVFKTLLLLFQTDDQLVTRLQKFFYENPQTTDDTTNIDYDYSLETGKDAEEIDDFSLPLIPIINENDTELNVYTVVNQENELSTVQYEIEVNDYSFRRPNFTESSEINLSLAASNVTTDFTQMYSEDGLKKSAVLDYKESIIQQPQNNSELSKPQLVEEQNINLISKEHANANEMSKTELPKMTSTKVRDEKASDDQFGGNENHSTTTSEFVINESTESFDETQTENSITNRSDTLAIHLNDYFDTILLNESLLIDDSLSHETPNDDYDSTTPGIFSQENFESSSSSSARERNQNEAIALTTNVLLSSTMSSPSSLENKDFLSEERNIQYDQQNKVLKNTAVLKKYVYSTTQNFFDDRQDETLPTTRSPEVPRSFVKFPDDQQITSPSHTTRVIWPQDNGHPSGSLMKFWQEQPLINDFKFISRGNSRGGGLNRVFSYRRNFR